jgi:hypothetical protein
VNAVGQGVIRLTPEAVKEFAIRSFGENDKVVLLESTDDRPDDDHGAGLMRDRTLWTLDRREFLTTTATSYSDLRGWSAKNRKKAKNA